MRDIWIAGVIPFGKLDLAPRLPLFHFKGQVLNMYTLPLLDPNDTYKLHLILTPPDFGRDVILGDNIQC